MRSLFLTTVVLAGTAALPAQASSLSVRVEGLRSSAGSVLVAVCTADAFDSERCPNEAAVRAGEAGRPIEFPGIAPGTYAVKVFHDENGNRRLDSDWLGIPTEGYGLSNDPPKNRKPTFAASAFKVGAEPVTVTVSLFYR